MNKSDEHIKAMPEYLRYFYILKNGKRLVVAGNFLTGYTILIPLYHYETFILNASLEKSPKEPV